MARIDYQPLLDTQQNQLSVLLATSDSIDNRTLAILASNITILIFIGQASFMLFWWQWLLLLGPFLLSLALTVVAIWPQSYRDASVNLDEHPEYLTLDKDDLLLQLLADTKFAITQNTKLNNTRQRYSAASFICTLLGSVILFAVVVA